MLTKASRVAHASDTPLPDAASRMIEVRAAKRLHPWVSVGVLIYAGDSLGFDDDGEEVRVGSDSIITGIVPEPWGALVAFREARVRREPGPVS